MMASIEDKIAKLLAMAEGTTNPHEAESFMAKAEELMLANGIERAQVEAAARPGQAKQDVTVVRLLVPNGNGMATALVALAHYIAPAFNVRTLQSSKDAFGATIKRGGKMVWFIGFPSDIEDVTRLHASLSMQAVAQAKDWWRKEGIHVTVSLPGDDSAYLARREFVFAFGRGAGSRLAETRNRVVAESGPGTELVLVDRAKLVDNWLEQNVEVGKGRSSSRASGGYAARQAGFQSGRDAVTGKSLEK